MALIDDEEVSMGPLVHPATGQRLYRADLDRERRVEGRVISLDYAGDNSMLHEHIEGLVHQGDAVHDEVDPLAVLQPVVDDRLCDMRLTAAGGHLENHPVVDPQCGVHIPHRGHLVGPEHYLAQSGNITAASLRSARTLATGITI